MCAMPQRWVICQPHSADIPEVVVAQVAGEAQADIAGNLADRLVTGEQVV